MAASEPALQHVVRKLTDASASEYSSRSSAVGAGRVCSTHSLRADRVLEAFPGRQPPKTSIHDANIPLLGRCPALAARPRAALQERRKALDVIKDSIEQLHTAQYPGFLASVFEPVSAQLTATQPQFERDSELQLLRHAALEVLSRLPANEALKQYATRLCDVCLAVRGRASRIIRAFLRRLVCAGVATHGSGVVP